MTIINQGRSDQADFRMRQDVDKKTQYPHIHVFCLLSGKILAIQLRNYQHVQGIHIGNKTFLITQSDGS